MHFFKLEFHKARLCKSSNIFKYIKMLVLYLDTLIIGHKCCSMLSKLNELTLQKELPVFMTNNVFGQMEKHNNSKTKKQAFQSLPEPGMEPGTSRTAV